MTKLTWLKRHLAFPLSLTAAVVLASCGQSTSPAAAPTTPPPGTHGNGTAGHASATPAPSSAPSIQSAGQRFDITVRGKQVTPRPRSIPLKVGETMIIAVTSDHDDTLHAHGFNITKSIKANQQLVFTVTGPPKPGLYEVELHDPPLRIVQFAVS